MLYDILVVDDDAAMCELLADGLSEHGFRVTWTTEPAKAEELVRSGDFVSVLTDIRMRGLDGLELCKRLTKYKSNVPVIVMTAFGSFDAAVQAIRSGAYDFLTKPLDVDVTSLALERAIQHRALKSEVQQLQRDVERARGFGELIGTSSAMQAVYDLVDRAAPSNASVLITGESGTGKELLARTIHRHSSRSQGPFVSINCAALPEALLESELFGHKKGAFTDARSTREGLLARASRGTLFLDEIAELPLGLQPKLLRVLQERLVRPVGADTEHPVDFRLVTATNRNLEAAIETRSFREDLFYRINVIHISLPPLRERDSDIVLLANHFVQQFAERAKREVAELSEPVIKCLLDYPWPGNVRELANCMERMVVLARGQSLQFEDLPDRIRRCQPSQSSRPLEEDRELVSLAEVERRHILFVLDAVHGNKSHAAQVLGLDRKTLYRRLEQYGVATGE